MVTPQDFVHRFTSQNQFTRLLLLSWQGKSLRQDQLKKKNNKTSRPLACPGEIKSSYLAGEVTSRHIRVNR